MLDLERLAGAVIENGKAILCAGGSIEFFGLTIYGVESLGNTEWDSYAISSTSRTYLPSRYTWEGITNVLTNVAQGKQRFVDVGTDMPVADVANYVVWKINRHGSIKIGGVIVGRKQGGGIAIRTSPKGRVHYLFNEKAVAASDLWDAIQELKAKGKTK